MGLRIQPQGDWRHAHAPPATRSRAQGACAVALYPGAGFGYPLAVCLNTKAKGMWVLAHLAKFEINIGP
jgi:hypothetical protein